MFRGALEPWHILILVLIVVILFGWKKLPDAARSLGRSARILKSELGDDDHKSSAAGQTVPGQTQPPAGSAPGEAPVPGATPYPQQGQQPPQGYQQQAPQGYQQQQPNAGYQPPQQQGQPQQQTPAGYPQQNNPGGNGN
ncbi:Sec-independent protein translocase subunit TatA [Flexivirga oryzae]|uniref:Sec-independent protein translocase protein TatA n=1 Tax=Flexivirga oryzae TaxID=1794944 RepID=A0A839N6E2_9MICO|nr:Sec-independent protein translocase subunit TatA [Flexivirga oryzae]MBB2891633.1 sec-independent protein translocase protein TatA [Flexivirga oryzae]